MGASSRLRTLQYIPFLENKNLSITTQSLFDEEYLARIYAHKKNSPLKIARLYMSRALTLFSAFKYDIIWIEKEIYPYLPAFAERALKIFGKPYIVDYDDAIFHNYDLSKNPIIRSVLGGKIDAVMRNSTCVIAGNNYLAERAKSAGASQIEIIPTVVDHTRYMPRRSDCSGRPVIGWIGSPSTQKYVVDLFPVLVKVCSIHNARLLLVGATSKIIPELLGLDVEILPWSEEREVEFIQKMDIGIMPLANAPWERGKCGYKLIQYMACAIPVIASPVGANIEIIKNSCAGVLANDLNDWEIALTTMLSSNESRKTMGLLGRECVEKKYSINAQAPLLKKTILHGHSRS